MGPPCTKEAVREAVQRGTALVEGAGGWLPAVVALTEARRQRLGGDHLQGVFAPELDGALDTELLTYLRSVASEGVNLHYRGPRTTLRAKPHASAAGHQTEAYEKMWEDAAEGRVLLAF